MASEADHIALANKNHATLLYLVAEAEFHPEWVATVAFYKAVQVVEAMFANTLGVHSNGHDGRIADLKRPQFKEVFKFYRPLYSASLVARYLVDSSGKKIDGVGNVVAYTKFTDLVSADKVVDRLVRKRLNSLENNAVKFLSEAGRAALHRVQKDLPPEKSAPDNEAA